MNIHYEKALYKNGQEVIIIDKNSSMYNEVGTIISTPIGLDIRYRVIFKDTHIYSFSLEQVKWF